MEGFDLEKELKMLPNKPGVYIMHDRNDHIIYVGKAIILKNRVRSYFRQSTKKSPKIQEMVKRIDYFEYIVTDSELEALVLECNLIKEHRPKYNTMLKDDKTYPYIKVTVNEEYPRLVFSRLMKKDKSRYFGPYTSAGAVKDTIDLINKIYKLRTCSRSLPDNALNKRECLNYHINRCYGPCQGNISPEEYMKGVKGALDFLNGNYAPVIEYITQRMMEYSEMLEFEKAAEYKELLTSVKAVAQKQKITSTDGEDKDVIAVCADETDAVVQVFFVRSGRMIGREHFFMKQTAELSAGAILQEFIKQFYSGTPFIPRQISIQEEIDEHTLIEEWLSERRNGKVTISVPQKGMKERFIELAYKNAQMVLSQDKEKIKRQEGRTIGAAKEIGSLIGVDCVDRMEAFDISNISGYESVGSMVVFEKGRPRKNDYRKFKIKTVIGPDDYSSMEEVLTRRFEHGLKELEDAETKESAGFTRFPDLILMDGGKGQVHVCLRVLEKLGLSIPVCGMVKDDHHRTRGLYFNDEEIPIDTRSEGFKLITRIQDEAHRFAIEYHRSLRLKGQVRSVLDEIEGIGPSRRKALLRKFGTVEAISKATLEELSQTESMNSASAQAVYEFFMNYGIMSEK